MYLKVLVNVQLILVLAIRLGTIIIIYNILRGTNQYKIIMRDAFKSYISTTSTTVRVRATYRRTPFT